MVNQYPCAYWYAKGGSIVGQISIVVTGMAIMRRLITAKQRGPGGNGGAAGAQAAANANGTDGTLTIWFQQQRGFRIQRRRKATNGRHGQNKDPLYRVELTV